MDVMNFNNVSFYVFIVGIYEWHEEEEIFQKKKKFHKNILCLLYYTRQKNIEKVKKP